jgi:hypothetical protein
MRFWRAEGYPWVPPTCPYDLPGVAVLAMPYYPTPLTSPDQIPPDVRVAGVPDDLIANFGSIAMAR